MKIPFHIITGFLGAGKTTFLNHILFSLPKEKRVGIVQNEFAPTAARGEEIIRSKGGFDILHINNGSVFCVCRLGHFRENLAGFVKDYRPDMLLLESSGLSDPSSVGEIVNDPQLKEILSLQSIICIADATNFSKTHRMVRYTRQQAIIADQILINKTDRISSSEKKMLKNQIRSLNPYAGILFTSYCRVNPEDVLTGSIRPVLPSVRSYRPEVSSMVLRTATPLSKDKMLLFLNEFSARAYRIKGVICTPEGLVSVQCTMNEIDTKRIYSRGITELIAISDEFSLRDMSTAYKRMSE